MKQSIIKKTLEESVMTEDEIRFFLKKNFNRFSNNSQLATLLGLKLSTVRKLCYQMGLKRIELEYFTKTQVKYLISHYTMKGDSELAEIFQKKWPKKKSWTKKHIEKKRKYLNIQRTPAQIKAIHKRNVKMGRFAVCPVKAWNKRGRAPEGEVRYWTNSQTGKKYPVIKYKGYFVHWARWAWKTAYGRIAKDMNVIFKDGNHFNLSLDNLALVSNQQLARLNAQKSSQGLSDNYIAGILTPGDPELRKIINHDSSFLEIKRKQLTLNRAIYEQQNSENACKYGR